MTSTKKVLANGVRVVLVPMKENPTVTCLVMVEAGSKYESAEESGLSHFLEHMCFKGTQKRPRSLDISRELDAIGASYNASTSREVTEYYAKSDKRHASQILEIVSDIYLNSTFPETEMAKEKNVIIEEIRMYNDDPTSKVGEIYSELLHGDQPAGRDIAGTEKTVADFTRDQLVAYHAAHYVPEATVVVISGGFDEAKMLTEVEAKFGIAPTSPKKGKVSVDDTQSTPQTKLFFKETDQTHLILGFRGIDRYDERYHAIQVLSRILGRGMSSRLFQKLREEMGVCYYVGASSATYTDHGTLAISCGVDKKRVDEVIAVLIKECDNLRTELVSDDEFDRAKSCAIGKLYLGLESSDSYADFFGYQELFRDKYETPDDVARDIQAVTKDQVLAIAKDIFCDEKMNLAIVGPYKDVEKARFHTLLTFL